jgi:hypothetical protein
MGPHPKPGKQTFLLGIAAGLEGSLEPTRPRGGPILDDPVHLDNRAVLVPLVVSRNRRSSRGWQGGSGGLNPGCIQDSNAIGAV